MAEFGAEFGVEYICFGYPCDCGCGQWVLVFKAEAGTTYQLPKHPVLARCHRGIERIFDLSKGFEGLTTWNETAGDRMIS